MNYWSIIVTSENVMNAQDYNDCSRVIARPIKSRLALRRVLSVPRTFLSCNPDEREETISPSSSTMIPARNYPIANLESDRTGRICGKISSSLEQFLFFALFLALSAANGKDTEIRRPDLMFESSSERTALEDRSSIVPCPLNPVP